MKVLARLILLIPALPSVTAVLLSTTVAVAQEKEAAAPGAVAPASAPLDRKKRCKLITAKRGGSAELVPDEELNSDRAVVFPYVFDDTNLREEFRVDRKRRGECLAVFGIQNAASAASAAGAAAAAAAAPGGVAAVGAGIGAGIGTISAGAIALGGIGLAAGGIALGVATAGGSGGAPGAPVTTVPVPPAP